MSKQVFDALLPALINRGQLQICLHVQEQAAKERSSLERLRMQPASFLNSYDRLFRHISLFVLEDGLMLSAQSPHQTLKVFCEVIAEQEAVKDMMLYRHAMKYFNHADHQILHCKDIATLCKILRVFDPSDAQACETYHQLELQSQSTQSVIQSEIKL